MEKKKKLWERYPNSSLRVKPRAQLFKGRLALNPGLNFYPGFVFLMFKSIFSDDFLCYF